jgi:hypothetical protein
MGISSNNGALGEMRSLVVDTMILQRASAPASAIRVPSKAGCQATQLDTLWTCAAILSPPRLYRLQQANFVTIRSAWFLPLFSQACKAWYDQI